MSGNISKSSLTHADYLRERVSDPGLRGDIAVASLAIVATQEELAREHVSALGTYASNMRDEMRIVSSNLETMASGLAELSCEMRWGFSEIVAGLESMGSSIDRLVEAAITPNRTLALEYFGDACNLFRAGRHSDAIGRLNFAIEGHGENNIGYEYDHRFHYLLGAIYLGPSTGCIDLGRAEECFLNAAKWATADYPKEAGRSYLGAGQAAYGQQELLRAEEHIKAALGWNEELLGANFLLAKICARLGKRAEALESLERSIRKDRVYTIDALCDPDLAMISSDVKSLLENLRRQAKDDVSERLCKAEGEISSLERVRRTKFPLADSFPVDELLMRLKSVREICSPHTYYAYLNGLAACYDLDRAIFGVANTIRQLHQKRVTENERRIADDNKRRLEQEQKCLAERQARHDKAKEMASSALTLALLGMLCVPFGLFGLASGIKAFSSFEPGYEDGRGKAIAAIVLGALSAQTIVLFLFVMLLAGR